MRPIQMVDTKTQYLNIKGAVDAAIGEVLDSAAYINGKWVTEFAKELGVYQGDVYTIPCAMVRMPYKLPLSLIHI